jgi:hypothetical protein
MFVFIYKWLKKCRFLTAPSGLLTTPTGATVATGMTGTWTWKESPALMPSGIVMAIIEPFTSVCTVSPAAVCSVRCASLLVSMQ